LTGLYGCGEINRLSHCFLPGLLLNFVQDRTVEYVSSDSEATAPNYRVRTFAIWEGWHGHDRKKYIAMLREAFEPFEPDRGLVARLKQRNLSTKGSARRSVAKVAEYRAIFGGAGADLRLLGALQMKISSPIANRRDGYTIHGVLEVKKKIPIRSGHMPMES
jgi:hypothetical protein